jgi:dihydropyrimidine dehydrogenase (NAD+) subunit PreA
MERPAHGRAQQYRTDHRPPLEINLQEIKEVKRDWPDRALIVSLMVPCDERDWKKILPRVEDTGATASN